MYAGGIRPLNPFYLGLYGGSELPGILESDQHACTLYREANYREIDRVIVLQCDLTRFRPVTSRQQLTIRRQTLVSVTRDVPTRSWWQASTEGALERTQFALTDRRDATVVASATFWNIEPLASMWGRHAAGLLEFSVAESRRRQGLATYLLSEALRQLRGEGVTIVEAQTMQQNTAALQFYRKMGFADVDRGIVLRKGK
jgi:ribosomal protein S18 acetylase RimI-like enzyme